MLLLGIAMSLLTAFTLANPTLTLASFVLPVLIGLTWRAGEPPAFTFVVCFQWLFATVGYFLFQVTGTFPGQDGLSPLDLSRAVTLCQFGLLAVAAGWRFALNGRRPHDVLRRDGDVYSIRRLLHWVVALYSINWFIEIWPAIAGSSWAQPVMTVLGVRAVLLAALCIETLRRHTGYRYAIAGVVYAILPQFVSVMSDFKDIVFIAIVASLSAWRPWAQSRRMRRRSAVMAAGAAVLTMALLYAGIVWVDGVKERWRQGVLTGRIAGSNANKLRELMRITDEAVAALNVERASLRLASRMSSGVAYFSMALARVPAVIPHQNGKLSGAGVVHVTVPRIIFPDKPVLQSDSWMIREFAGARVAGAETGTSVGLGYLAEFYVDFGISGMVAALFLYGVTLGLLYRLISATAPSAALFGGTVTFMFIQHFMNLDGNFAKQLGGIMQFTILYGAIFTAAGPSIHGYLSQRPSSGAPRSGPRAPTAPARVGEAVGAR